LDAFRRDEPPPYGDERCTDGLPNRISFQDKRQIEVARVTGTKLGVVAIDLNRFKEINDIHGHKAGDDVLITLARRMTAELGRNQMIARLGGDEFVGLIRFDNRPALANFTGRIKQALEKPLEISTFDTCVGASIGVAIYPDDADAADTLTNNADMAMYRAKSRRAPEPCYYDAVLDDAIRERRDLANDLRQLSA
jgi:diguanylate cyclase (GGDEF)-like protein